MSTKENLPQHDTAEQLKLNEAKAMQENIENANVLANSKDAKELGTNLEDGVNDSSELASANKMVKDRNAYKEELQNHRHQVDLVKFDEKNDKQKTLNDLNLVKVEGKLISLNESTTINMKQGKNSIIIIEKQELEDGTIGNIYLKEGIDGTLAYIGNSTSQKKEELQLIQSLKDKGIEIKIEDDGNTLVVDPDGRRNTIKLNLTTGEKTREKKANNNKHDETFQILTRIYETKSMGTKIENQTTWNSSKKEGSDMYQENISKNQEEVKVFKNNIAISKKAILEKSKEMSDIQKKLKIGTFRINQKILDSVASTEKKYTTALETMEKAFLMFEENPENSNNFSAVKVLSDNLQKTSEMHAEATTKAIENGKIQIKGMEEVTKESTEIETASEISNEAYANLPENSTTHEINKEYRNDFDGKLYYQIKDNPGLVSDLQVFLGDMGYQVDTNGTYDDATNAAVKNLQETHLGFTGKGVDGYFGPDTLAALTAKDMLVFNNNPAKVPSVAKVATIPTAPAATPKKVAPKKIDDDIGDIEAVSLDIFKDIAPRDIVKNPAALREIDGKMIINDREINVGDALVDIFINNGTTGSGTDKYRTSLLNGMIESGISLPGNIYAAMIFKSIDGAGTWPKLALKSLSGAIKNGKGKEMYESYSTGGTNMIADLYNDFMTGGSFEKESKADRKELVTYIKPLLEDKEIRDDQLKIKDLNYASFIRNNSPNSTA